MCGSNLIQKQERNYMFLLSKTTTITCIGHLNIVPAAASKDLLALTCKTQTPQTRKSETNTGVFPIVFFLVWTPKPRSQSHCLKCFTDCFVILWYSWSSFRNYVHKSGLLVQIQTYFVANFVRNIIPAFPSHSKPFKKKTSSAHPRTCSMNLNHKQVNPSSKYKLS